jgi:hypothetical protein
MGYSSDPEDDVIGAPQGPAEYDESVFLIRSGWVSSHGALSEWLGAYCMCLMLSLELLAARCVLKHTEWTVQVSAVFVP